MESRSVRAGLRRKCNQAPTKAISATTAAAAITQLRRGPPWPALLGVTDSAAPDGARAATAIWLLTSWVGVMALAATEAERPESVSRLRRFRSLRISEAL